MHLLIDSGSVALNALLETPSCLFRDYHHLIFPKIYKWRKGTGIKAGGIGKSFKN